LAGGAFGEKVEPMEENANAAMFNLPGGLS
jgi:hypothetical protein